jgi:hypothetical protein
MCNLSYRTFDMIRWTVVVTGLSVITAGAPLHAQSGAQRIAELFPDPGDALHELCDPSAVRFIRYQATWDVPATNRDLAEVAKCRNVRTLIVRESAVSDAGLEHLSGLKRLEYLNLGDNPRIHGHGLTFLATCPVLRHLVLSETSVTSDDVARLRDFPALERLDLSHTSVGDGALEFLIELSALRSIDLSFTAITDNGLERLVALKDLQELALTHTRITDAGMAHIGELRSLRRLALSGTTITDSGLKQLNRLTDLEDLHLSGNGITDDGIVALESMENLQRLFLSETATTNDRIDKLKETLPELMVTHLPARQ